MVLAEALLRVPDAATADRFIEDKLEQGDFAHHQTKSSALAVNASAWALGLSAAVIQPGETPQGTIGRLVKRIGLPAVRIATRQAMRLMGNHFVLGETIDAALERAHSGEAACRALFVRHARRRRAHGGGRQTLSRRLCERDRCDRPRRRQPSPARPSRHFRQTVGAASALRGDEPRARDEGAGAAGHRARAAGEELRPEPDRRCGGSRPARTVARRDRRRSRRHVARRLGRLWPCRAGLSEARRRRDRLSSTISRSG